MANPQKENGYLSIANEIMDALIGNMPDSSVECGVLLAVLRKTYGWNKKEDDISISQLEKMTNASRRMIVYAIQNLEAKGMILVERYQNRPSTLSFQKDYEKWNPKAVSGAYQASLQKRRKLRQKEKSAVQAVAGGVQAVAGVQPVAGGGATKRHFGVQAVAPTKDTTKDTITKDNTPLPPKGGSTAKAVAVQKPMKPDKTEEEKKLNAQVVSILEAFQKSVNPGLSYGHKTNREAAKWMIATWGFDRTMKLVEYAISIHGEEFAPTIATPYDLKVGFAKVSAYYKKHATSQAKNKTVMI